MTPNWTNCERGAQALRRRHRTACLPSLTDPSLTVPGSAGFQPASHRTSFEPRLLFLKLGVAGILPFFLSACQQSSINSDEREALLRKSIEVNRSYVSFFRGSRTVEASRRRMRNIIALVKKIGDNNATGITEQLMDLAFEDTIAETKRIFKPFETERCELVHMAGSYYARHSQLDRAEQFYRQHIADLTAGHRESRFEDMELQPKAEVALIEDLQLLAPLLDAEGKPNEASECRQQALLLRTKKGTKTVGPADHIQLGNSYASSKDFESARFEFKKALASNPDSAITYSANLGMARLEAAAQNYPAATQFYELALSGLDSVPAAAGDFPGVELELARVHRSAGKLVDAMACQKKAIAFFETKKIASNDVYDAALSELAEAYIQKKQFDLAELVIEKCVADTQRNPGVRKDFAVTALRLAAELSESQGKDAQAKSYYQRMVDMAKSSTDNNLRFLALLHYGQFLERKDIKLALVIFDEAITELEKSGSLDDPGRRGPYLRVAVDQTLMGNYERAQVLLEKAHKCALNYQTTFSKADTVNGTKEFRAANGMMRLIISRIAETYCYQGKFKKAEEYFNQGAAVEKGPEDLQDAVHLNEFWALKSWLIGDTDKEKDLFALAKQQRETAHVDEKDRLFRSLKKLVDVYGKPASTVDVSLIGANRALDEMRAVLGPNNLYYVTTIKHLCEKFESAGHRDVSIALSRRAEQDKIVALKAVPREL